MSAIHDLDMARIDLNLFRVFSVVERERSVGRAATHLAVSQSAVSHALARLRDQVGDPLFVRQGRSVAPTPFATALAPQVRRALRDLEQAVSRRESFDPRVNMSHVRIAIGGQLEPVVVPPLVAALRAANPRIALTTIHLDRTTVRDELTARRLDLALDVARPAHREIAHEELLVDELCVVARKGRRRLDRADYLAAEHVAVSSRARGAVLEDYRLAPDGIRRRIAVRCQSYETAVRLVAESDLLLTLPRRYAKLLGLAQDLRAFPAPVTLARIDFHSYWLESLDDDPATRWLRAQVRTAFA